MEIETEFGKVSGSPAEVAELLRELRVKKQIGKSIATVAVDSQRTKVGTEPKPRIVPFSKHRRNKKWSGEEDVFLVKLVNAGRKYRLIAKDIGRTVKAVNLRVHILKREGNHRFI